jgi:hypothetical protein
MKPLPIPEEEQLKAMVDGTIYDLLAEYIANPRNVDFRKFITVKRARLIEFLQTNPGLTDTFFKKCSAYKPLHDAQRIFERGSQYCVSAMDRGRERDVTCFKTLPEAVAEYVLVEHGMY